MTIHRVRWLLLAAMALSFVAAAAPPAQKIAVKSTAVNNGNGAAHRDIGKVRVLDGNVLVSRDSALVAIEGSGTLQDGSRVITTAGSRATVEFDDDCQVELKPNQRLPIESSLPCTDRRKLVESMLEEEGAGDANMFALGAQGSGGATTGASGSLTGSGNFAGAMASGTSGGSTTLAASGTSVGGAALIGSGGGAAGGGLGLGGLGGLGGFGGLGGPAAGFGGLLAATRIVNDRILNNGSPN